MKRKYKISIILTVFLVVAFGYLLNSNKNLLKKHRSLPDYDKPDAFFEYYRLITTPIGEESSGYETNYRYHELTKLRKRFKLLKTANTTLQWIQRGPGNVGGRTRTVVIDPDDSSNNTWFAASVSGGIWKTTDAGETWACLTDDLPNLSTTCMAIAPSKTNVIYVGTGEGYGGEGMVTGNGIYISPDKGLTWELLESTDGNDDFRYVNKVMVHPLNDSIVLAATNTGIFKSIDAGITWEGVYTAGYAVQDLAQNPLNYNVIYAGANSFGVLKTYDFGSTWTNSSEGIGTGYRFSLAVSPVDTSYVYTSVEAPNQVMDLYLSTDAGESWSKYEDADGTYHNFHGTQGWFNNVIAAHPFDKNKFYVGGVDLGIMEILRGTGISELQVIRTDTLGTGSFLAFVNFGGTYLGGGLITGLDDEAEVEADDFVSVEIRFGPGISQKAHRFTVPKGEGAGVPPEDYSYQDYVTVPFQAWDVDNNKQLMISFRDQDRNGEFNLVEQIYDDDTTGREYIFIHYQEYSESEPDADIAQGGGHYNGMLYFIWPTLPEDKVWNPNTLPESYIQIKYGTFMKREMTARVLADDRLNEELHVDHHDLKIIVTNEKEEDFIIVDANDGGLGYSDDGGLIWKQIDNGYLTTQFYGMAKKTGAHEYIGGMQDNGTWQSPLNESANKNSEYKFQIEGDGFEVLWHPWYPHRIIGSSYNNYFKITNDGGESWGWTYESINGDGPFISKLSHSRDNPNLIFAVGSYGLYVHRNFGFGRYDWEKIQLGEYWSVNDQVTSSHNVKVSKSNPAIVWAGGGMYFNPDLKVFRSVDYGQTFDTATIYFDRELGYISGMATHPTEDSTAYLLFSYRYKPKILRTADLGRTWEDISGFGQDSSSSNGFPDVMVHSLCVMPDNPQTIWVGTDIGIIESTDNGESWHLAQTGLPAVSVWQIEVQDESVMVATHGRGIWSARLDGTVGLPEDKVTDLKLGVYPNPVRDILNLEAKGEYIDIVEVKMFSLNGKLVFNQKFNIDSDILSQKIDVSGFQGGTYLLKVVAGNLTTTEKIIIL